MARVYVFLAEDDRDVVVTIQDGRPGHLPKP